MKDSRFRKDYNANFFENYKLTLIKPARAINVAIRQGHHREMLQLILLKIFFERKLSTNLFVLLKVKVFCSKLHKSLTISLFV